jgi:hypothetical protein
MVHDMLPTFEKNGQRELSEWKITADVYTGDVANRRKGTLCVRSYK